MCNERPYLGKDPSRKKENDLPTDVCLSLLKPYFKKGYNATTGNFFSNIKPAETLNFEKTTIIGTIRKQRKEIPSVKLTMKKVSTFFQKYFFLIQTVHLPFTKQRRTKSRHNHKKKRPETVEYYNKTKAGVDALEQMFRCYTCKSATRRRPVAYFFVIVCACINAFIVYKEVNKSSISRKQFLSELVKELRRYNKTAESEPSSKPKYSDSTNLPKSLKRKHCQIDNCPNKSNYYCIEYKKFAVDFIRKQKS